MKKLSPQAFTKRVKDTIDHYAMIRPGDKVLVAVSGGPDSVCLLEVLLKLRDKLGIELVAANLDHGIRGKASKKDSDFVKGLSRKLGIKCVHKKVKIRHVKGSEKSLEERARDERYKFFHAAAKKYRCGVIATGHTMDDQAETVALRIVQGSTLKGLAGIPPVREENGIRIIRPLIRTEKKEVLDHLGEIRRKYRVDRTNKDNKYFRNKVRNEILPFLEKYNPRIRRALVNISDMARENPADVIRREIFKKLFERAGGNIKKLTYRHWMDVDKFLRSGVKQASLDLPGRVKVVKAGDRLEFKR